MNTSKCFASLSANRANAARTGFTITAVAVALAGWAGAAKSFEVEGPLSEVGSNYIVCNGARINTGPGTQFVSPTAGVSMGQLTGVNFPDAGFGFNGAPREGFKLGTCIASGDDATNVASTVFVEIAENVIVGNTTHAAGQPLAIMGVQIVPIEDMRMSAAKPPAGMYDAAGVNNHPAETARNQFGFGVDLTRVPANDFAAAEGHLSAGTVPKLYAHTIETTGGELKITTPRASLQRAQCRNEPGGGKDQIEILGSCVLPANATSQSLAIWVRDATSTARQLKNPSGANATVTCVADPESPGFGVYRFRNDRLNLSVSNNGVDACPAQMGVTMGTTGLYDWTPGDNR